MDIGDTESIQLVVRPNSKGTLSRTATATSDEDDADTSDNSVTVTTTVESGGDPVPDPDPTPGNEAPAADAGSDQTVGPRDRVYLDGGGSGDADGTIASYRWQQISGKKVSIKNANSAVANFSAPGVKRGRTKVLVFELTVTDNDGATASDQVTVTVTR
jgi:chitinase